MHRLLYLSIFLVACSTSSHELRRPASYPESSLDSPQQDRVREGLRFDRCDHRIDENYKVCLDQQNGNVVGFWIENKGPNSIVTGTNPDVYRSYRFHFPDRARQDIHLRITDAVNGKNSGLRESYLYFFPRKYLPSVRYVSGQNIVTLPTEEEIIFSASSSVIQSGVLKETVALGPHPAHVLYKGIGVLVRVDAKGVEPRRNNKATITYGRHKCRVPASELWPDQSKGSAFHFRFATDAEFSSYLKKRKGCGFSF